jgi:hypothetical protein
VLTAKRKMWLLRLGTGAALSIVLSSCLTVNHTRDQSETTSIEGPSNRESAEEAGQVQEVLEKAGPQPVPLKLDGCWHTDVKEADSFKPLISLPPDSLVTVRCCTPVEYELCFNLASDETSFSASNLRWRFNSSWLSMQVVPKPSITDVLYSDNKELVVLRSVEEFTWRGRMLGVPAVTLKVSSKSEVRVAYSAPERIFVEGSTEDICEEPKPLGCAGQPWVDTTWHAEFLRQRN